MAEGLSDIANKMVS